MREELRKEATTTVQWECTPMVDRPTFINGYITGAEPREKHIADLEKLNKELQEELNKQEDYRLAQDSKISFLITDNEQLKEQIEKMKSDVKELITDRMNDDLDQNIIEHLFEKWELSE